jgi:UMF1 family MFS transporter
MSEMSNTQMASAPAGRLRRVHDNGIAPVGRRELAAWSFYDFANSGYTTVVITAVFNAFFVGVIAGGADWATFAWTLALSISYALVIVCAPVAGAWADLHACKKRLLAITTFACATATAALALCGPGDIGLALALVILSNLAYSLGENLIAAFLPELASDEAMGRLSGYGWAVGYIGGLLVLALCLFWIQSAESRGSSTVAAVPQTMLITAVAFVLAALPTLMILKERAHPARRRQGAAFVAALAGLRETLVSSRGLVDLRRFLVCIVCYQAGVATVIAVAAIFTTQALGFTQQESIVLILVVNISAAIGALAFGLVQDRVGHRLTLAITLVGWLLAIALFFASEARWVVWTAANLAGICLGSSQSAGRALVGYLCPHGREGEIFGLWGLAVRVAMILGPVSYGLISWITRGDHRLALLSTAVFFVAGLALLTRVDVERGHRAARSAA